MKHKMLFRLLKHEPHNIPFILCNLNDEIIIYHLILLKGIYLAAIGAPTTTVETPATLPKVQ